MLEKESNKYLLLIGQNAGATGMGVNYKNYLIIDLSNSQIIEIESISDNPLNVYLDAKGLINVIVIDEDWEETQNHTRVNLKYYPIIYRNDVFNKKSSERIVGYESKLKCYNLRRKSN